MRKAQEILTLLDIQINIVNKLMDYFGASHDSNNDDEPFPLFVRVIRTALGGEYKILHRYRDNPVLGKIGVEMVRTWYFEKAGFGQGRLKSFIIGNYKELERRNYVEDLMIKGQIIIVERIGIPFYNGQSPKMSKSGIVYMKEGLPIYRKTEFTEDQKAADILIQHSNTKEIDESNY